MLVDVKKVIIMVDMELMVEFEVDEDVSIMQMADGKSIEWARRRSDYLGQNQSSSQGYTPSRCKI